MALSSAGPDGLQDWRRASVVPGGNRLPTRDTAALRDPRAAEEQTALPPDLPLEAPPGRIIIHLVRFAMSSVFHSPLIVVA
jgi:hypothetical protein